MPSHHPSSSYRASAPTGSSKPTIASTAFATEPSDAPAPSPEFDSASPPNSASTAVLSAFAADADDEREDKVELHLDRDVPGELLKEEADQVQPQVACEGQPPPCGPAERKHD